MAKRPELPAHDVPDTDDYGPIKLFVENLDEAGLWGATGFAAGLAVVILFSALPSQLSAVFGLVSIGLLYSANRQRIRRLKDAKAKLELWEREIKERLRDELSEKFEDRIASLESQLADASKQSLTDGPLKDSEVFLIDEEISSLLNPKKVTADVVSYSIQPDYIRRVIDEAPSPRQRHALEQSFIGTEIIWQCEFNDATRIDSLVLTGQFPREAELWHLHFSTIAGGHHVTVAVDTRLFPGIVDLPKKYPVLVTGRIKQTNALYFEIDVVKLSFVQTTPTPPSTPPT